MKQLELREESGWVQTPNKDKPVQTCWTQAAFHTVLVLVLWTGLLCSSKLCKVSSSVWWPQDQLSVDDVVLLASAGGAVCSCV